MDFAAKFERNRLALLRLVFLWLAVARVFGFVPPARIVLPSRMARFVAAQLFKMEAAAGFLILCSLKHKRITRGADNRFLRAAELYAAGLSAPELNGPLTLAAVIARLRALRNAMRGLRDRLAVDSEKAFAVWGRAFASVHAAMRGVSVAQRLGVVSLHVPP